jgi:23S rRNA (guanosine2251-2'-O)-methyltransferase
MVVFGLDDVIPGRHPVREALLGERTINKILLQRDVKSGILLEIMALAKEKGVMVQKVEKQGLNKFVGETVHQGVIALVSPKAYATVEELIAGVPAGEDPFLLLLDEINDPHNLGAILRTSDAAGVHGVIIPRRRSAPLTPTVAKASAGAIEHVPVARVANMVQVIDTLKKSGIWLIGADALGRDTLWESQLSGPLALVIGGEDKGLGRLVKERCDLLVSLPMLGRVNSLNASVATALFSYEVVRQRREAAKNAGVSSS